MLTVKLPAFPLLQTERLSLRQLTPEDSHAVFRLLTDEGVNKHYGRSRINSFEEACIYIEYINVGIAKHKLFYWAIELKDQPGLVGTVCLWNLRHETDTVEIGYELLPEFQGKGIMQEILPKVIAFGFDELQCKKIDAWPNLENERSIRLLEKNNFTRDREAERRIDWSKEPAFYRENEEAKRVATIIYSLCLD